MTFPAPLPLDRLKPYPVHISMRSALPPLASALSHSDVFVVWPDGGIMAFLGWIAVVHVSVPFP